MPGSIRFIGNVEKPALQKAETEWKRECHHRGSPIRLISFPSQEKYRRTAPHSSMNSVLTTMVVMKETTDPRFPSSSRSVSSTRSRREKPWPATMATK